MRLTILIITLLSAFRLSAQDTVRQYFFDDFDLVKNNYEVVLIVRTPQTEFAKTVGDRIYRDSLSLAYMQQNFFKETILNDAVKSHFCGYDMYFFLKRNNELHYFRAVNSQCALGDIAGSCTNTNDHLTFLAGHGSELKEERYTELPRRVYQNRTKFRKLFSEAVYSEFSNDDYGADVPHMSKSVQYVPQYYDEQVTRHLALDSTKTIKDQVKDYFATNNIDTSDKCINWSVENYNDILDYQIFGTPVVDELILKILFTSESAVSFDNSTPVKLQSKKHSNDLYIPLVIWREERTGNRATPDN